MEPAQLRAKVEQAKRRLVNAEEAMNSALRAMEPALRSDKTIISKALGTAFAELRAATADVSELERLVASEK